MKPSIPHELRNRPFHLREAQELGLTRDQLKGAQYTHIYTSVYAEAGLAIIGATRVLAAQIAIGPSSCASYETGLSLYGIKVGADEPVHLSTRPRTQRRIRGIVLHRHNQLGTIAMIGKCRVLSPERCFVDAANHISLANLVAVGDGLLANGHTTSESLLEFVTASHCDGVLASRRAVKLVTPGSESFRESLVRVMLELAGLPAPECNVSYGTTEFIARLDMSYRQWLVAIEYDGRQHGLSLRQRERDVRRRELMEREGWTFIVVTAAQLNRPKDIVNRVHRAMTANGHRGKSPEFSSEWVQNFERPTRFAR